MNTGYNQRLLRDAEDSLEAALQMVKRLRKEPLVNHHEAQAISNAGSQVAQAAKYMEQLFGSVMNDYYSEVKTK